jgi:hypothetical protein
VDGFPQLSRQQLEDMFDDMRRRYERAGAGLRAVHKLACKCAMAMGDVDLARRHQRLWRTTPAGAGNDCAACERNDQVNYLIFVGKDDRAIEHAAPILLGRLVCGEIPHITLAHILLPLLRLGRVEEAAVWHQRGYRLVRTNREFLAEVGRHLRFLALTDNWGPGLRMFESHLAWAVETFDLSRRFEFYLAAHLLLDRLHDAGRSTLDLRLPRSVPMFDEKGHYDTVALRTWLAQECRTLAARFDARNGNDYFTRRLETQPREKELVSPYPLP